MGRLKWFTLVIITASVFAQVEHTPAETSAILDQLNTGKAAGTVKQYDQIQMQLVKMSAGTKKPLTRVQLNNLTEVVRRRIEELTKRKFTLLVISEDLLSIGIISHTYGTKTSRSTLPELATLYTTAIDAHHDKSKDSSNDEIQAKAVKGTQALIRALAKD